MSETKEMDMGQLREAVKAIERAATADYYCAMAAAAGDAMPGNTTTQQDADEAETHFESVLIERWDVLLNAARALLRRESRPATDDEIVDSYCDRYMDGGDYRPSPLEAYRMGWHDSYDHAIAARTTP